MTELNGELKRKHKAAGKCHTCLKEFVNPDNKKVRDYCHYAGLHLGVSP